MRVAKLGAHKVKKTLSQRYDLFSHKYYRHAELVVAFIFILGVAWTGVRLLGPSRAETGDVVFPGDANSINVKLAPYNAKGDGVTDDSDALLKAFFENDWIDDALPENSPNVAVDRASPRTIYLPAGTYLVTKELLIEGSTLRIIGAGKGKTILKLKDNTFTNSNTPKYLLKTGNARYNTSNLANTGFANYIQHLTIDIGKGNPGAIGVRYNVANTGSMQHVEIKSSDPAKVGKYGLAFETSAGPALIKDVVIHGFDYGVFLDAYTNNVMTFEDLRLENQKLVGIYNQSKNIVLENLVTVDSPVSIQTEQAAAAVMMISSTLDGTGTGPAISMPVKGFLYLRDITTTGYSNITTIAGTSGFVGKSTLKEWSSENYRVGSTVKAWTENNEYVGLNLPIKKAPDYSSNDLSTWANVETHGATAGTSMTDSTNSDDDGPAIQRAIDSGAETIYFPYGYYTIRSSVIIRGNVKKIDFFFSRIDVADRATVSVENTNGDSVILENAVVGFPIYQNGPDTLVIRNMKGVDFQTDTNATGDVFIENTGAHTRINITEPINVWARSMDRTNAEWLNSGGSLWVLSNNIESDYSPTSTTNGGKTEIIGGTADNLGLQHLIAQGPLFSSTDSFMSVFTPGSLRTDDTGILARWEYLVHDQYPTGTTDIYDKDDVNLTEQKFVLPLYVTPGYTSTTPPPPTGDTTAPTASVTSPFNGATVSGAVTISATASDNVGVTRVEFWDGATKLGEDATSPYSLSWTTSSVNNGSHSLKAVVYDATGNSGTSSVVTVTVSNQTTDTTPPSTPTNLTGSVVSSTQVNLTWTKSTDNVGVTKYYIYRSTGTIAASVIAEVTTTSYSDTGAAPNTAYSYYIRALDAAGNISSSSNIVVATTPPITSSDTTPPTSPANLAATVARRRQVNLSWKSATDNVAVASYRIYRDGIEIGRTTSLTFGDGTVRPNQDYAYTVRAVDAAGNLSQVSNRVTVNTGKQQQ